MKIIRDSISLNELKNLAINGLGSLVKAVVDVERKIMAIGGMMHADEEQMLLCDGSKQENLWGINIYPDLLGNERIEFDSMINIRPSAGNMSRTVENAAMQNTIREIVSAMIQE